VPVARLAEYPDRVSPYGSENAELVEAEARGSREAAGRFFAGGHRLLEAPGIPIGYSGSAFARVETPVGSWSVRRWPPDLGVGRLRFVHRALAESRSRGFSGVPALAATADGETVLHLSGRLYDAQEFLGGEPLAAHCPPAGHRCRTSRVACRRRA
jgi:hypothetical protein